MVPEEIRAGACIEVWTRPKDLESGVAAEWGSMGLGILAYSRHRDAAGAWMAAHGLHAWDHLNVPGLSGGSPWSFEELKRNHPEYLVESLNRRNLPRQWTPTYVQEVDYGPSILPGDVHGYAAFKEWRAKNPINLSEAVADVPAKHQSKEQPRG